MKKRFFLIMIFIILLTSIFVGREKEEKYYNTQISKTLITEKALISDQDDAINGVTLDFIVPIIFFFVSYMYFTMVRTEFKIGTVIWRPKYRKQMPRGNLA